MSDYLGPRAILASAAIPGFFPPTEVGAQPFVDGGVVLNTPLLPAIDARADILHVIYMDPDVSNIPTKGFRKHLADHVSHAGHRVGAAHQP